MHKQTRKFGGHVYHLFGKEFTTKAAAERSAMHLRNRGPAKSAEGCARVVKEPHHNEWLVYYRKK